MAWPTPQDYNEAVQNPRYTFSDPELQEGSCELTTLGLPKPITGNFASVYRMRCRGRDWAVRCFWRELSDMQQRYRAISAHLGTARLPYTVGFEYQPQGIRIRGSWYPVLKMEWVEGQLLNDYLVSHLQDPVVLQALMDRWVRMVSELEQSGCAHGDLQHGNVLVVNGELKLVDYDGMFVPALAGMGSHELGQQHYQHPGRGAADFGPHLDRFSSWVIYLSIRALHVDPYLWTSMQAGDERLLLQRQDFENPASSASLALLTDHADPGVQSLAQQFRGVFDQPLNAVPSLASVLQSSAEPSGTGALPETRVPLWLQFLWRFLAPSVDVRGNAPPSPRAGSHPAWVVDHLPVRRVEPAPPSGECVRAARAAALAALPLIGVGAVVLITLGVPIIAVVMLLVLAWSVAHVVACVVAYRHDAAVRRLLPLVRREVHALRGIVEAERATQTIAARVETIRQRSAHDREQAATRKTELRRQEEARLDELRQDLAERLDAVDHRMCDADRREAEEAALVLEELQHRHIRDALRRATLRSASIPGFGPALKMRFWSLGVWAAADVSSDRIGSMQHVKHEHLMEVIAWRVGTETSARRTMPRQLPTQVQQAFHSRYARERDELLAERSHEHVSIQQTMEGVEASFNRRCARVEEQLRKSLEDRAQQCDRLETRLLEIAAQEHVQRADLVAVRQEMEEWGGVSFLLFLQSVYAPWMSRLHGRPRTRRY